MLVYIFVVLFLAGNALGNHKANDFVENLLKSAFVEEINFLKLDPAPMSNFSIEFEDTVKIKGKAAFKKGNLSGLTKAKRLSDCQGHFDYEPQALNCTIGWGELKVVYKGKLKYRKIPSKKIRGKAKLLSSNVYLEISKNSSKAILKKYVCVLGNVETRFTGEVDWSPLNRFLVNITEDYKQQVLTRIFDIMTEQLRYAFERALTKVLFPSLADQRGGDWGLEPPPEL